MILNEYGWLWLNRDGSPTLLTDKLYPKLLGAQDNAENRRTLSTYLLGGETEFWRAYRRYAGVLQFVYLTSSEPNGFTSDQFVDVQKLTLEPHFEHAMEEAFNPLGVYLNFWHDAVGVGQTQDYTINLVNDEDRPRAGRLRLVFADVQGRAATSQEAPFALTALGTQSYSVFLTAPTAPGRYSLQAIATPDDNASHPTVSRREVTLQATPPTP